MSYHETRCDFTETKNGYFETGDHESFKPTKQLGKVKMFLSTNIKGKRGYSEGKVLLLVLLELRTAVCLEELPFN